MKVTQLVIGESYRYARSLTVVYTGIKYDEGHRKRYSFSLNGKEILLRQTHIMTNMEEAL